MEEQEQRNHKGHFPQTSPARIAEALELLKSGMTNTAVAKQVNISRMTLARLREEHAIGNPNYTAPGQSAFGDSRRADYSAQYMREWRKARKLGQTEQFRKYVRTAPKTVVKVKPVLPVRVVQKGDIFDVAARLEKALSRTMSDIASNSQHILEANAALAGYTAYWNED